MTFYLWPIETHLNYRGPKYLKCRANPNGLIGPRWSLKDFGGGVDIGLLAYDGVIERHDILALGEWSSRERGRVAGYLRNSGVESGWITGAAHWREGLQRLAGTALAMQAGVDNPDTWLGKPIYCGFARLNPIDRQAYETRQVAKAKALVRQFGRPDILERGLSWLDWLKIAANPLMWPFMALPKTDAFTGTNGTQLETYDANWDVNTGSLDIQTNAVAPDNSSADSVYYWSGDTPNADQYVQGTVAAIAGGLWIGPATRVSSSALTCYLYASESGFKTLGKFVGGSYTDISFYGSGGWSATNVVRLESEGTTQTPMIGGSEDANVGAQTDASITAANFLGLYGFGDGTGTRLDNFEGGNLGGGPTEYTIDLAGSITPTGALIKQVQKNTFTGTIAPTGALIRQIQKMLTGSMTPTGSLVKQTQKTFGGVTTPTGALVKEVQKTFTGSITPTGALAVIKLAVVSLAGSITPTGNLVKETQKVLSGSITPTGITIKETRKTFTGSIEPTGTVDVIKSALISLAGSITPTGTLIRQTQKGLAGQITPTGNLIKQTLKNLSGSITPTGDLSTVKAALISLAGSITPTGALTRQVQKILSGSVTPTGDLSKQAQKDFAGDITPTGNLIKQAQKVFSGSITPTGVLSSIKAATINLAGSIAPVGTLVKQIQKPLTGTIEPTGQLIKQAQKTLTGSITPTGDLSVTKVVFLFLAGMITPVGTLTKQIQKILTGEITPTGVLTKLASIILGGVITPTGSLTLSFDIDIIAKPLRLREVTNTLILKARSLNLRLRGKNNNLTLKDE